MDIVKIGKFLAQLRRERNYTQEQLGGMLGVSNKTISRWENGVYLPPVEMLQALSDTYSVSINELLSGERLSGEKYVEMAEDNLKSAVRDSAFSRRERIAYFRGKWRAEHRFELVTAVIICLICLGLGVYFHRGEAVAVVIPLLAIYAVMYHNRMMTYVENKVYGGSDSNDCSE